METITGRDCVLRRMGAALALAILLQAAGAQADMQLLVGEGTMSGSQAQEMAVMLSETMGEHVLAVMAQGRGLSERIMDGDEPQLAIAYESEIRPWAKEGFVAPLGGEAEGYALAVGMQERRMAVRAQRMEEAGMDYLLDERAYPAWAPLQVLQALDELALSGCAGLEVWAPEEEDTLFLEAFLQGVSGEWFQTGTKSVQDADMKAVENALEWLGDMARSGLIGEAENREAALSRFIGGESAIFIDWSQEESVKYAQEIRDGEIVLMPYPSASGVPVYAARMICLCALDRAAADALMDASWTAIGEKRLAAQDRFVTLDALEDGATLKKLICESAREILSGEAQAKEEAARIARVMKTAGRER